MTLRKIILAAAGTATAAMCVLALGTLPASAGNGVEPVSFEVTAGSLPPFAVIALGGAVLVLLAIGLSRVEPAVALWRQRRAQYDDATGHPRPTPTSTRSA